MFLLIHILFNTSLNAQSASHKEISDAEINKYLGIPTFDSLLKQTDYDRELLAFNYFPQKGLPRDARAGLFLLSRKIEQYAIEHHHQNLLIEFESIEIYYNLDNNNKAYLERLLKLNQEAINNKNEWGTTIIQYLLALNYMNIQEDFPKGFLLLTATLEKIESDKSRNYFIRNMLLYSLEGYHYMLGDYVSALGFGRRVTKMSIRNFHIANANLMGVIYRNLNQLDSSNSCFNLELQYGLEKKDSALVCLSSGNLGENYYLQKNYSAALPLLSVDAKYHYSYGYWGNASNAYLFMAGIYIAKGDLPNAEACLKIAEHCVENVRNTKNYPTIEKYKRHKLLYEMLTKYYIATSKPHFALLYFDSAKLATDSITNMRGRMTVLKTDGIFKLQQSEIQKLQLKNDLFYSRIRQVFMLVLFIILSISSAFGFVQYRTKIKSSQTRLQLEKEKVEEDLSSARAELALYVKELLANAPNEHEVNWKERSIITPEHWQEFIILFDKSCPGYYKRLTAKIENLTEAELRLLCLLKLNLSDVEMSNILGVNKNTIQQTRSRLKKKISITTNEQLSALVQSI